MNFLSVKWRGGSWKYECGEEFTPVDFFCFFWFRLIVFSSVLQGGLLDVPKAASNVTSTCTQNTIFGMELL